MRAQNLQQFIVEALYAARDNGDATMQKLDAVVVCDNNLLDVTIGGQRFEVVIRAAEPGYYALREGRS